MTGPSAHSNLLGGSTARRRMECPASMDLEPKAPNPASVSSPAALKGTALHDILANAVENRIPFEEVEKGFPGHVMVEGAPVDLTYDDFTDIIRPSLNAFGALMKRLIEESGRLDEKPRIVVEKRVDFPGVQGSFGTADIVFRAGDAVGVIDWKTGFVPVVAEENAQLLYYFAAAKNSLPLDFFKGAKRIVLGIIQPAANPDVADVWETDDAVVNTFINKVWRVMQTGTEDLGDPCAGDWCRYCSALPFCPTHIKGAEEICTHDTPNGITTHRVAEVLALADKAEMWIKAVKDFAKTTAEQGTDIPGYKLVLSGRGIRKWKGGIEKSIGRFLTSHGLGMDDIMEEPKMMSPAKVEKLIKGKKNPQAEGKDMEPLVERTERTTKMLVPEDDARPSTESFADITDKLSAGLKKSREGT